MGTAENATLVRNTEGIHKDITCPITFERFVDPVVASDGRTYERAAIERWFATGSTVSPITGAPLNNRTLVPCHKIKAIANAYATITQNNDNVQSMDAQLQVVRGEYQQRLEKSVRNCENLVVENAALRQQLATANDSIGVKDQENANCQQRLANGRQLLGVKDHEMENLRQQLANANDTIESLRIQTKTYANGNVYEGQMKDGEQHGKGKMVYNADDLNHSEKHLNHRKGEVYEGDWKNDNRDGKGIYKWADGDVYVGAYKDDKKHGNGTYTWANGNVYDGDWKDDKMHGKGTFTWNSGSYKGDVYVGEFKDDKKHGKGTYTWNSGSCKGHVYVGDFKDNKKH